MRSLALISCLLCLPACKLTEPNPEFCEDPSDCLRNGGEYCDIDGDFSDRSNQCVIDFYGADCEQTSDCAADLAFPVCNSPTNAPEGTELNRCRLCSAGEPCAGGRCDSQRVCQPQECDPICEADMPICNPDSAICEPCVVGRHKDCRDFPGMSYCVEKDGTGQCVACEFDAQCPEGGACRDFECIQCQQNSDCESEVCHENKCIPTETIVYVDNGLGGDGDCTLQDKCMSINTALSRVTEQRNVMYIARNVPAGDYEEAVTIENIDVQIISHPNDRAVITSTVPNIPAIEVKGASQVVLENLVLEGVNGGELTADGLRCYSPGASVSAKRLLIQDNNHQGIDFSGCELVLERSYITNNGRGGVSVWNANFSVTNSFIVENGTPGTTSIGVDLLRGGGEWESQTFSFNTVYANDGDGYDFACSLSNVDIDAVGNIVFDGNGGANVLLLTVCGEMTYSNIEGIVPTPESQNISEPPLFDTASMNDYDLDGASPGTNFMPDAPLAICTDGCVDYYGTPRPTGVGYEMGAHEIVE